MKLTTIKTWIFALILVLAIPAQASIITIGFSGTIDENHFDIPVGTIISAGFSYDTNATTDFVINTDKFPVFDVYLTMMGQTVTNHFGYLNVDGSSLSLQSGARLIGGGSTPFSSFINGIEIGGLGFYLNGSFTTDVLPTDPNDIYGLGGTFFVNRSLGVLFDVNAPDLLQIPPSNTNANLVSAPATASIFLLGLSLLFCRRRKFPQA